MKEKKGKILGTLLFVLLILSLIFLIFFKEKKTDDRRVETIILKMNNLLEVEDYLSYTKLDDKNQYKHFTLPVIKNRIEKHPYVKRADVEFKGMNKVNINLVEKDLKAILIVGKDPYLITDDFEILPLFSGTKSVDLPILSNPENISDLKLNSRFINSDVIQAFKIMDAAGLVDEKLRKKIAEINLRNGKDILLTISGLHSSIIFGRKDEAKKMIYLSEILNESDKENFINGSSYIDLRFNNYIYFGGYQIQTAGFTE